MNMIALSIMVVGLCAVNVYQKQALGDFDAVMSLVTFVGAITIILKASMS